MVATQHVNATLPFKNITVKCQNIYNLRCLLSGGSTVLCTGVNITISNVAWSGVD